MPGDDVPVRVRQRVVAVDGGQTRMLNPVVEVAASKHEPTTLHDPNSIKDSFTFRYAHLNI